MWVELILSTFEDLPTVSDEGRWRVTRRKPENYKWWKFSKSLNMHFDKKWIWFPILMWFCIEVLKLTNLSKWAEQPKSCTGNENSTKNWKNELDFIWKDSHSRSWRNKSHSIPRDISWDSIENKFSQSTMKKFVSWGSIEEKFKVWCKNALCCKNGVRSLSFLTLKSFHTSQTLTRWKILKSHTKLSLLSKISSKLSLLVYPLALQS